MTEKNKVAPSKNNVTCVFNKYSGIDKFWSEFVFLSEMTYTEKKIFKAPNKLYFPLCIDKSTDKKSSLIAYDPEGKKIYESSPLFKKEFKEKYMNDNEFKQWFDYCVDISCQQRITNGMFKLTEYNIETNHNVEINEMEIEVDQLISSTSEQNIEPEPELDEIPFGLEDNKIEEEIDESQINNEFEYQSAF